MTRLGAFSLVASALLAAGCAGGKPDPTGVGSDPATSAPAPVPHLEPASEPASEPAPAAEEEPAPEPDVAATSHPVSVSAAPAKKEKKKERCDGERLASGKCKCAYTRCFDICCGKGEVCIHPAEPGGWSKCARRRF